MSAELEDVFGSMLVGKVCLVRLTIHNILQNMKKPRLFKHRIKKKQYKETAS